MALALWKFPTLAVWKFPFRKFPKFQEISEISEFSEISGNFQSLAALHCFTRWWSGPCDCLEGVFPPIYNAFERVLLRRVPHNDEFRADNQALSNLLVSWFPFQASLVKAVPGPQNATWQRKKPVPRWHASLEKKS